MTSVHTNANTCAKCGNYVKNMDSFVILVDNSGKMYGMCNYCWHGVGPAIRDLLCALAITVKRINH